MGRGLKRYCEEVVSVMHSVKEGRGVVQGEGLGLQGGCALLDWAVETAERNAIWWILDCSEGTICMKIWGSAFQAGGTVSTKVLRQNKFGLLGEQQGSPWGLSGVKKTAMGDGFSEAGRGDR